jgi:NTP pyrophosphatase (non-canonical NTP hydrolase)
MTSAIPARDGRQRIAIAWAVRAFTAKVARNGIERAQRFFEEAGELAQAVGLTREQCDAILDRVFARPRGSVEKEIGDAGLTLITLAEAEGYSADECEARTLSERESRAGSRAKGARMSREEKRLLFAVAVVFVCMTLNHCGIVR